MPQATCSTVHARPFDTILIMPTCQVGTPGVNGLSVEQRKRLTIAVELVANPSIVFMDGALRV